ncbi:MAG TPA: glycoside hydrolase family 3 N-terminal domain-containing protein [Gemmatimonadales bacterium]|nr:glycoside hydrolase family 3 N-terminal domain-containing protein [Gemmatimonadales bacterium]
MNAGRLILPALRWRAESGFDHEAAAIRAALEFGAGGFILFGGRPEAVSRLTSELCDRAGRPLLIAADLERGAGQQFAGMSEFPPPAALAALDDPDAIRTAAATTAREALALGINWVLAPVADLDCEPDNPIVQTRSFSADPERTAFAVATWVRACQEAGALACVKHFPGHGRTTRDSHDEVPTVSASAAVLREEDLAPFRRAVEAGVASVMTAHVRFPALDPAGLPATFSPAILDLLRTELGFDGLVVTDALMMGAALRGAADDNPAARALAAGCDLLCYPDDPVAAHRAIEAGLRDGSLGEERVGAAIGRYEAALGRHPHPPAPSTPRGEGTGVRLSDKLLQRGFRRHTAPVFHTPIELVIVDDDQGGAWPATPNDYTARALEAAGVPLGAGGSRIVLAFAEPRASKGRAGFGPGSRAALAEHAARADLVVLFAHPRLATEVPGPAPLLLAWHRQRLMQEAVARWIVAHRG